MRPLWSRDPATLEERAALDLASALSDASGAVVVSIEDQASAARFVRENGWQRAVDLTVDIRETFGTGSTPCLAS